MGNKIVKYLGKYKFLFVLFSEEVTLTCLKTESHGQTKLAVLDIHVYC